MELPDVMLGDMFALLGEKDVKIFQLEKKLNMMEGEVAPKTTKPTAPPIDPFKKGK